MRPTIFVLRASMLDAVIPDARIGRKSVLVPEHHGEQKFASNFSVVEKDIRTFVVEARTNRMRVMHRITPNHRSPLLDSLARLREVGTR
jgi:hypothetical protein